MILAPALLASTILISAETRTLVAAHEVQGAGAWACDVLFARSSLFHERPVKHCAYGYFAAANEALGSDKKDMGAPSVAMSRILFTIQINYFDHPEASISEIVWMISEELPLMAN